MCLPIVLRQANPELGLKTLIPPVAQTILDLSEDVQDEEKLDQELLFNLLLLKEVGRGWLVGWWQLGCGGGTGGGIGRSRRVGAVSVVLLSSGIPP